MSSLWEISCNRETYEVSSVCFFPTIRFLADELILNWRERKEKLHLGFFNGF